MTSSVRVEAASPSPVRCPYCHDSLDVDGEWSACATCLARHHPDCWVAHGKCGTCGRARALRAEAVVEKAAVRRRAERSYGVASVALALFVALVALATYHVASRRTTVSVADLQVQLVRERQEAARQLAVAQDISARTEKTRAETASLLAAMRAEATRVTLRMSPFAVTYSGAGRHARSDLVVTDTLPAPLRFGQGSKNEPHGIVGEQIRIVARGELEVLVDGTFELLVRSSDKARVFIDDAPLELSFRSATYDQNATMKLAPGKHAVRVEAEQYTTVHLALDVWRVPSD